MSIHAVVENNEDLDLDVGQVKLENYSGTWMDFETRKVISPDEKEEEKPSNPSQFQLSNQVVVDKDSKAGPIRNEWCSEVPTAIDGPTSTTKYSCLGTPLH